MGGVHNMHETRIHVLRKARMPLNQWSPSVDWGGIDVIYVHYRMGIAHRYQGHKNRCSGTIVVQRQWPLLCNDIGIFAYCNYAVQDTIVAMPFFHNAFYYPLRHDLGENKSICWCDFFSL